MAANVSAWHGDDAVAYRAMRAASEGVIASLLSQQRGASESDVSLSARVADVWRRTLAVDGFDRAAVDQQREWLRALEVQIAGTRDGE